jgi:hypothetical protein
MRHPAIGAFLLLAFSAPHENLAAPVSRALAAAPACNVAAIPASVVDVDSSILTTSSSSWTKSFAGGQTAYVKLSNFAPPHVTGVRVRFFAKTPTGEQDDCLSQVLVTPLKEAVYSWAVFSSKPFYNVETSLVDDVDVANIVVAISTTKP